MDNIKHILLVRAKTELYLKSITAGIIYIVKDKGHDYEYQLENHDECVIFEGVTLELPWKENKKNISCIPEGEYFMAYREDRKRWELQNVSNRSGIQIHAGTKPQHSKGCIILPDIKGFDKALEPYRNHILKIIIL